MVIRFISSPCGEPARVVDPAAIETITVSDAAMTLRVIEPVILTFLLH